MKEKKREEWVHRHQGLCSVLWWWRFCFFFSSTLVALCIGKSPPPSTTSATTSKLSDKVPLFFFYSKFSTLSLVSHFFSITLFSQLQVFPKSSLRLRNRSVGITMSPTQGFVLTTENCFFISPFPQFLLSYS